MASGRSGEVIKSSPLSGGGKANVPIDSEAAVISFMLYVAARTTDSENSANSVYVQLAKAHWQFDGSGTLVGAGVGTFGQWQPAVSAGNSGDNAFTIVTTGARVPLTSGVTANQAGQSETWTTKPGF